MQANIDNFSLNAELDDESHTELADVIEQTSIPSAEDEMQEQSRRQELLQHMSVLSPKERLVLTLRHGISDNLPKRVDEVAAFLIRPVEDVARPLDEAKRKICEKLSINESELAVLLLSTNPQEESFEMFFDKLGDLSPGVTPNIDARRWPHLNELRRHAAVQRAVEDLPLDEKTVLKLRYGILQDEELTLRDIGEILGLSRERVRQIESRAEAKCRRAVKRS
jgi:DNA-directed RNA polymerase sigma subunit (sigma70/sigma32)